jgi:hypothetical protein
VNDGDVQTQGGTPITSLVKKDKDLVAQEHKWGNLGVSMQEVDSFSLDDMGALGRSSRPSGHIHEAGMILRMEIYFKM